MLRARPLFRSKIDAKTNGACFFLLAVALLLAAPAAQAQEVQVAFDEAGEVTVIDAELRERLGLFPEVDGFEEARLFRQGEGAYELVIRYAEGGRSLREQRALSAEEVEALRRRVRRARGAGSAPPDERAPLEGGRYRFLAATTALGLADVLLLVAATGPEDEEAITAAALLGGTAGFFVPLLLTRDATVTEAEATLTGYGGFQGIGHGVLLSVLVSGGEVDGRGTLALMGALSATEAVAGFRLARATDMRGGTAETMTAGGLYGTSTGAYAGLLVTGGEGNGESRIPAFGSLAGSVLGAYGGHRLARAAGYTQGDARIFGTAGLVSTQLAGAALVVADRNPDEDARVSAGALLAGTLGGLALGHRLVRGRDFGVAQGNIAALGALAGSLAGGAVGIIADANEETSVVLSALGSVGGFAGTYFTYRGEAQARERQGGARLRLGLGSGAALRGGEGGPLGAFTPALNARLTF
jgi:hypothetical protein